MSHDRLIPHLSSGGGGFRLTDKYWITPNWENYHERHVLLGSATICANDIDFLCRQSLIIDFTCYLVRPLAAGNAYKHEIYN